MKNKTAKIKKGKGTDMDNYISKSMTFYEILEKHPEAANVLFNSGLHCIGCGMAMYETLEQGCEAHGMNKKQIEELLKKINGEIGK